MGNTKTWVDNDLITSPAFLSLKGIAPQTLLIFLSKRRMSRIKRGKKKYWECTNQNQLEFTYKEALSDYGIHGKRFTRAIDQLLARGFITITHAGGAYQQDKTKYGLSDQWMMWTPGTVFEKRQPDVKRGFQRPPGDNIIRRTRPPGDNVVPLRRRQK